MFINDVLQPHRLGTEPYEHSNAMLHGIQWEFTVNYFLIVIGKLLRICKGVIDGGLKLPKAPCGYASSLVTYLEVNATNNHSVTSKY